MTKLCIKIHMKSDSAIESAFPSVLLFAETQILMDALIHSLFPPFTVESCLFEASYLLPLACLFSKDLLSLHTKPLIPRLRPHPYRHFERSREIFLGKH